MTAGMLLAAAAILFVSSALQSIIGFAFQAPGSLAPEYSA
jgi:hypothetical protein